jgi:ubiquinone/menaquinone biosynthesis C-methylase UbiE
MSDLYKHPEEYDREHLGDDEDIGFYLSLTRRLAPRKVLELGCGTGRITLPLAQLDFDVVGLDNQPEMLQKAEERRRQAPSESVNDFNSLLATCELGPRALTSI